MSLLQQRLPRGSCPLSPTEMLHLLVRLTSEHSRTSTTTYQWTQAQRMDGERQQRWRDWQQRLYRNHGETINTHAQWHQLLREALLQQLQLLAATEHP